MICFTAMFGTAFAGGLALFKFYRPNSNTTIRFARARILAQGTLIACLSGLAIMGLSGGDGQRKGGHVNDNLDLSKRRFSWNILKHKFSWKRWGEKLAPAVRTISKHNTMDLTEVIVECVPTASSDSARKDAIGPELHITSPKTSQHLLSSSAEYLKKTHFPPSQFKIFEFFISIDVKKSGKS